MTRNTQTAPAPMFAGVGRSHRLLDLAAIALCLSFIGGFVAHISTPTSAVTRHATLLASTAPVAAPAVRVAQ